MGEELNITELETDYSFLLKVEEVLIDVRYEQTTWNDEATYYKVKVCLKNKSDKALSVFYVKFALVDDSNKTILEYESSLPITMSGKFDDGLTIDKSIAKDEKFNGYIYFNKENTDTSSVTRLLISVPSSIAGHANPDSSIRGAMEYNDYYINLK